MSAQWFSGIPIYYNNNIIINNKFLFHKTSLHREEQNLNLEMIKVGRCQEISSSQRKIIAWVRGTEPKSPSLSGSREKYMYIIFIDINQFNYVRITPKYSWNNHDRESHDTPCWNQCTNGEWLHSKIHWSTYFKLNVTKKSRARIISLNMAIIIIYILIFQ